MNFSLDNFGAGIQTMDVVLYAGVALIVYVLFQEKIHQLLDQVKDKLKNVKAPELPSIDTGIFDDQEPETQDDVFFQLIMSWKQTRDLAEQYGADKAVAIADQMFPHLVPKDYNNETE